MVCAGLPTLIYMVATGDFVIQDTSGLPGLMLGIGTLIQNGIFLVGAVLFALLLPVRGTRAFSLPRGEVAERLSSGLGLRRTTWWWWAAGGLGALTIGLAGSRIAYWLQTFDFPSLDGLDTIAGLLTSEDPLTRFVFMICVVVAAPIVEEVIFRGYLWRILEGFLPPVGVLLGTTLAFSAIHLDPIHVVALLPTALFLGLLRAYSDSLFPCILAHFVNNSLAMLTTHLISLEEMDGFLGGGVGSDDMIAVAGGLFSFMCIAVVWWKKRTKT